jgi:hypothetical protein
LKGRLSRDRMSMRPPSPSASASPTPLQPPPPQLLLPCKPPPLTPPTTCPWPKRHPHRVGTGRTTTPQHPLWPVAVDPPRTPNTNSTTAHRLSPRATALLSRPPPKSDSRKGGIRRGGDHVIDRAVVASATDNVKEFPFSKLWIHMEDTI